MFKSKTTHQLRYWYTRLSTGILRLARTSTPAVQALVLVLALSASILYTRAGAPERAYAATASTLNFQARLLTSNGAIVPDGSYNIEFKLYNSSTGGTAIWTETRTGGNQVTVKNGYLSVYLGDVNTLPTTGWDQEKFLTMNVNSDGEMSPRLRLTAVPYAFQAQRAEELEKLIGSAIGSLLFPATLGQNTNYNLIDPGLANVDICLSTGNCAGAGGGITGSGTTGRLSYFNSSNTLTSSVLLQGSGSLTLDAGTNLIVDDGNLTVNGSIAVQDYIDITASATAPGASPTAAGRLYFDANDNTIKLSQNGGAFYDICTTGGNCAGSGSGVTAAGTSAGYIPVLTGTQQLGNSWLFQDTATSTIEIANTRNLELLGGNLTVNGNGSFAGTLTVTGLATFNGGVTVGNNSNFTQTGTGTFSTGTGAVSLNGNTSVTGSNTFTVGTGLTTLGGGLTATGTTNINATGSAATVIGNTNATLTLNGSSVVLGTASVTRTAAGTTTLDLIDGASTTLAVTNSGAGVANLNVDGRGTFGTGLTVTAGGMTVTGNSTITGTLSGLTGLASSGTITFSGLNTIGIVTTDASGQLSTGTIDRNSATYFTGTLSVANGGTGAATLASNGILFGNGTGAVQATGSANDSVLVTGPTGTPSLSQTLPLAVQGNITATGALDAGSITAGFGSIDVGADTISTTGTVNAGTLAVSGNGTVGGSLTVTGAAIMNDTLTVAELATFNGGLVVTTGQQLTNQGSTLFTAVSIANRPTGGTIGTAAATVDVATTFNVNQTTTGQTLTLPTPTDTTAGRIVYINNIGTANFTMSGVLITAGRAQGYIWTGTAWTGAGIDSAGDGANQVGAVDGQPKSANGAVITNNTLYLQTADASFPGLVSTGAQTFAGSKTFSAQIVANGGISLGTQTLQGTTAVIDFTNFDVDASGNVDVGGTLTAGTGNAFQVAANGAVTAVGVNAGSGLLQGTGGLTLTGAVSINTTGTANTSIGNASGTLIVTGSSASTFVINGTTISAAEFILLDGRDAALVDINDAVNTAITGVGTLTSGSISSGFGTISTANNITTTAALSGGSLTVTNGGTFGGNVTVSGGTVTVGASGQAGSVILYDGQIGGSANTLTLSVDTALGQNTVITFPDPGAATAEVCYRNDSNCGFALATGNNYVFFTPNAAQVDNNAFASIYINDTGGGNLLHLQSGGNDMFVVANNGDVTMAGDLQVNGNDIKDSTGTVRISLGGTNAITGNLDVSGGLNVGNSDAFTINVSGAITAATGITSSGTITFSGLSSVGIVTTNGSGVLATGTIDRNSSSYFTGTLGVANGGTGATTFNTNGVIYYNGTTQVSTTAGANSVLITNASNVPSLAQTLPNAVQDNITRTGALNSGSITSGFGSIDTGADNIQTTGTVQGGIVNATTGFRINGGATTGNYLRGDGTNFVSSALLASDLSGTIFSTSADTGTGTLTTGETITIQGGTNGIDTVLSGDTWTLNLDTAEINSTTFGDNTQASIIWGFDPSGATNPTFTFANDSITLTASVVTLSGDLRLNGNDILDSAGTTRLTVGSTNTITGNLNITGNGDFDGTLTAGTGNAFQVSASGAVTAVGVNSGTGLIQGSGGLTVTGASNINTTGAANTAIGNATGTFQVTSSGVNITTAGAISGVTTLNTSGIISIGTLGAANNNTVLCRNVSNQIASCNDTFATTADLQGYVQFAPAAAQADNSANPSIFINDTAGGNLLQLQSGGTNRFIVDNNGNVTSAGSGSFATGLTVVAGGMTVTGNSTIAGTLSGLTGLSSSGAITFSGLTANRLVATTTGGQLTTSITSANIASSITNETGTGVVVFGTSPTFTTSILTGSASFDLLNTTASTVNAFGAATTINIGAATGTTTINNNLDVQGTLTVGTADAFQVNASGAITGTALNAGSGTVQTTGTVQGGIVNATTGFRINGGATTGNYLRGNGTNFVSSALLASDLSGTIFSTTGDSGSSTLVSGDTISIQGGTNGIDTVLVGDTWTLNLDTTEINDTTFGDNTDAAIIWGFDPTGATNPTFTFANDSITLTASVVTLSGDLRLNGNDIQDSTGTTRLTVGATNAFAGNLTASGNADFEGTLTAGTSNAFVVNASGAITAVTGITTTGGYTQSGTGANTFTGNTSFSGTTSLTNTANLAFTDATAFRVQNTSGADTMFTVDTAARGAGGGNRIKIGNSTGTDGDVTILQVDSTTADITSNLSVLNGGLFYNSTTNRLKAVLNGAVDEICTLTASNCVGAGSSVTQNGTNANGQVAFFTSTNNITSNTNFLFDGTNVDIGGSLTVGTANAAVIAANGNITTAGDLAVNGGDITSTGALNITPGGALTVGATGQNATLQGAITTITSSGAGNDIILSSADAIELQGATNVTGSLTVSVNADIAGTLFVGTGDAFQVDANGNITTAGDLAVNGGDITSTGALNITPGGALTIGATNQTALMQGSSVSITSNGAGNDVTITSADQIILNAGGTIELQDNTNVTGNFAVSGNADVAGYLYVGSADQFQVDTSGNIQTSGDLAVNGGDITSTGALNITPGGTLTLGVTTQSAVMQGSMVAISSSGAGNDITLTSADQIILNAGSTIELQNNTNITGNLDVTGSLAAGSADQFQVSSGGTLTFTGVATDITTGANEDLTVVANGTGIINLDDIVRIGTLAAADTDSYAVCRDASSGQLSACDANTTGRPFLQGGNSFGATAVLGTNDNQALQLKTNNVVRLEVQANGNIAFNASTLFVDAVNNRVAIGANTTTGSKLTVVGEAGLTTATFRSNPGAVGGSNNLVLDNTYGAGNIKNQISFQASGSERWALGNDINGNGGQDFFLWDNIASQTRLYIDSSGRLGVNTTSIGSQSVIHALQRANTNGYMTLERSNNTYELAVEYLPQGARSSSNVAWYNGIMGGTNRYAIWSWNGAATQERLSVSNSGNVGIGSTLFTAKLAVRTVPGDNVVGLQVDQEDTTNNNIALLVTNLGTGYSLRVNDESSDASPFIIDNSGNVGIKTQTASYDLSFGVGANRTLGVQTQTTLNTAGNNLRVVAATGNGTGVGGLLELFGGAGGATGGGGAVMIQGGSAGGGNNNGGGVTISGGAGTGTGVLGLVNLAPTAFSAISSTQVFGVSGSLSAGLVDTYSTIPVSASATGVTVTIPAPHATNQVVGRILYVSNVGATNDFNIFLSGTSITIALKPNTTATLIWNGNGWTAAGASSSTDLQSAYNNTLTSAGGAEIVLNPTGGAADGFTIRNNPTTPIMGGILEVQSSIGTNLFSVNNFGTELAANGGAETASTFGTNWTTGSPSGATVSRTTNTAQFVTGQAGVSVATTTTALTGVRNNLAGNPVNIIGARYQVSFTAKSSINGTQVQVDYSRNGGTNMTECTSYGTGTGINYATLSDTNWTKVTCTITIDSTTAATDPDLFIRKLGASAPTIYIDNLSFIRNDTTTQPSNVQVGGGINGGQVTLFTLDRSSAPPVADGNEMYLGSMYYDTTTGRIQCYEADGWGACGSAPDNIIILTPEYSGAVLNGSGVGTMTADFCANSAALTVGTLCGSNNSRQFYAWNSPQATTQQYSIYVSYKLPSTFKSFESDSTINLTGRTSNTSDGSVTYEVFRSTGSAITRCFDGSNNETTVTTSADVWQTVPINGNETSCGFSGGDNVIFKINVRARNNATVYVENLSFVFMNN